MDNDFKTWVGVIHSFARHKVIGDKVELPFVEFAKLCGIPSSQSSRKLRERVSPHSNVSRVPVSSHSRTTEKHTKEYIIWCSRLTMIRKRISSSCRPIHACLSSTSFNRKVLQLKAINALKRRESAQALYPL
ncbi:hypothetical protein ACLB1T_00545 [Escherichia coli]